MKATFEHSIDVLVRAYLNDTLEHNNCYACAVGNLVADANDWHFTKSIDNLYKRLALVENSGRYHDDEQTNAIGGEWYGYVTNTTCKRDQAEREIASIGYTPDQIYRIEKAFEKAPKGNNDDDWMFNGLMAVVDILAEIHGIDLEKKEEAKAMFKKCGQELEPIPKGELRPYHWEAQR